MRPTHLGKTASEQLWLWSAARPSISLAFSADNNNGGGSTVTNNNGPPQLTFTVALVPTDVSNIKLQNGVVAQKIAESTTGAGNLAQSITPGATFGPAVIYIDQSQQGLPKKATTKWGFGGCASSSPLYSAVCTSFKAPGFCHLNENTTSTQ